LPSRTRSFGQSDPLWILIETERLAGLPEGRRTEYLSVIPVGRLGTVEEGADTVSFRVRPETGYITGQVIGVNGSYM